LCDPGIIINNKLTIFLHAATPGVSVITSVNNIDLFTITINNHKLTLPQNIYIV